MINFKTLQLFLVGSLIFISNQGFSQEGKGHYLYLDPIQVLGVYDASIDFGYLYKSGDKVDCDFGIGIIIHGDYSANYQKFDTKRAKGKGIQVRFAPRRNLSGGNYIAFSTTYSFHQYQSISLLDNSDLLLSKFNVKQQVISGYLQIGGVNLMKKKVYSDFSFGIGLRIVNIDNNSSTPIPPLNNSFGLSKYLEREENGRHYMLGVKLSYKFGVLIAK
jgi:hypothetical protein